MVGRGLRISLASQTKAFAETPLDRFGEIVYCLS